MIFDFHYLIFVYFLPFIIFFGALFTILSKIFPNQKNAVAIMAIGMSAFGVFYMVSTGFAQSFFLSFIGKSVEIIGLGGVLAFFISLLGIKMTSAIENNSVKMAVLMIFSLIMLWIFNNTSFAKTASQIFGFLFLFSFLGFGYYSGKKIMKKK